jgi:uncharacterized protein (TIGR03085 family)
MSIDQQAPNRFARAEREALCDLFEKVGPEHDTLCEGWVTKDLAAHLVVREGRNVFASAGVVGGPFAGLNKRKMDKQVARPWPELIDAVRQGPPRGSMMRSPKLDGTINTVEFFVHHEDVLRAAPGAPRRVISPELAEDLWNRTALLAKRLTKGSPVRVVAVHTDGRRIEFPVGDAPADRVVTLTGAPGELIMWLYRRNGDVDVSGTAADVAALKEHLEGR